MIGTAVSRAPLYIQRYFLHLHFINIQMTEGSVFLQELRQLFCRYVIFLSPKKLREMLEITRIAGEEIVRHP